MIAALAASAFLAMAEPPKDNVLPNGGFDRGLARWTVAGAATATGDGRVRLGPGSATIRQRYEVPGLRILWFGATLTPSAPDVECGVRLECFDAANHRVLDLRGAYNPKTGAGIYTKTQARTKYATVSIEKRGGGEVFVDDALLLDDDRHRVPHAPLVDLDVATRPFWRGRRIEDESVLLSPDRPAKLLFPPTRVISIRDATLTRTFQIGRDVDLKGDALTLRPGSTAPSMADAEFKTGEFPWTELQGRHVYVTYQHDGSWAGPVPASAADRLPRTVARLKAKKPVRVVAYGDSITLGINVSGFRDVPPYLPPWPELFGHALRKGYGGKVEVINAALGGMTSQWAKDNARDTVGAIDPDLVIVAFGMNDFWSLNPVLFRANIEATLATIRSKRPECEFLLVAPMKFDPAYTADPTYVGNLAGYAGELRKLEGKGVALVDMTAMTDALYAAKSAKDLATDPMHPDDFLARVYAQSAATLLLPPPPNR